MNTIARTLPGRLALRLARAALAFGLLLAGTRGPLLAQEAFPIDDFTVNVRKFVDAYNKSPSPGDAWLYSLLSTSTKKLITSNKVGAELATAFTADLRTNILAKYRQDFYDALRANSLDGISFTVPPSTVRPAAAPPSGGSAEAGNTAQGATPSVDTNAMAKGIAEETMTVLRPQISGEIDKVLGTKLHPALLAAVLTPDFTTNFAKAVAAAASPTSSSTSNAQFSPQQLESLTSIVKGNTTDLTSALGEVVRRNSTNEITKDDIQPIAAKLGMSTLIEWGLLVLVLAGIGLGFYLLNATQGKMTQANVALNGALKSLHEDFNQLKSAKSGAAPASSDETIQLVRQKMKDVDEKILKGADETRRRLDEMVKGFEEQAKQFQLQSRASRESLDGVVERFREQGEKSAAALAAKLSAASLDPVSKCAQELSGVVGGLEKRLHSLEGAFSHFVTASQELTSKINSFGAASAELTHQIEDMSNQRKKAADSQAELRKQVEEFEETKKKFYAESEERKRKEAEKENAIVPAFFRQGGSLNRWLDLCRKEERKSDRDAIRLLGKIKEFEALCHPPEGDRDPHQIAALLYELSRDAHRFWKKQGGNFNDTATDWRDAFNGAMEELKVPVQIRAIFPADRFDAAFMIPAEGSSDNRLYVKEALSWAVLDRANPERSKVLHYGQVLTV